MQKIFLKIFLVCTVLSAANAQFKFDFDNANSSIIRSADEDSFKELMVRGLWDDIVKTIYDKVDEISKLIKKYIEDPEASINDLKGQLLKVVNDTVEEMKKIYKEKSEEYIGDLQKMVECFKTEADKLGVNIKSCYDKTDKQILDHPPDYLNNITKCGTDEYEAGMKLIKSATNLGDGIIDKFNNVPGKIEKCGKESWWNTIPCFSKVAADLVSLAIDISSTIAPKIQKFVDDISKFVKEVPIRIKACAFQKTVDHGGAIATVGLKFYDCIKDKLNIDPKICIKDDTRYF